MGRLLPVTSKAYAIDRSRVHVTLKKCSELEVPFNFKLKIFLQQMKDIERREGVEGTYKKTNFNR